MSAFWEQVRAGGLAVPDDRPLDELTAELTTMLGDPDPSIRDGLACATLTTWITGGVYDDLLQGLGDGMTTGLWVGLGENGTDTVFRRSFSARVLTECLRRENLEHLLPADAVLRWGDRVAGWFVREQDLRGFVPGKGWAHSVAHGADAIAGLGSSMSMGRLELIVLLDVLADRLLEPTEHRLVHGEADRLAAATMTILRRDLISVDVLEPWLTRLGDSVSDSEAEQSELSLVRGNVQSWLRALHLQLALTNAPPACRADALLVVIEQLRRANPQVLGPGRETPAGGGSASR